MKFISTISLYLIITSSFLLIFPVGTKPFDYSGIRDYGYADDVPPLETWNGTYLIWDTITESEEESWDWLNQAWEFGPYPTFRLYLWNGTEVTTENFIPLGEEGKFKVVIEIDKSVFTGVLEGDEELTLGRTGLHWHTDLKDPENGTWLGSASVDMVYVHNVATHIGNETNTWHINSMVYNQSDVSTEPVIDKPSMPDKDRMETEIFVWDKSNSSVTENSSKLMIEIVGFFNETTTPVGPFWVNLEVTDSQQNWIDFGYTAWADDFSPNRGVAVGKPGLMFGGYEETWSFQKLDMENRSVYSVSRGDPWKMRVNVISRDLANVTLAMPLPWDMVTYVNRTDWHQETRVEKGGWLYNETAGTYDWDPNVNVTRTIQVYGPYLEKRWIGCVREPKMIDVTQRYWQPDGTYDLVTETIELWPDRLFLVYDHTTHNFMVKQGYSYWGYDPVRGYDRDYLVMEPVNTSDPSTRFYNLSISECSWSQIREGEYMIEFVGYFSNTTYSEQSEYWIEQPRVQRIDGEQIWCNWEEISHDDFQIAVDKLVCVTTVFDSLGREVTWGTLQVDPGSFFTIHGQLQGAGMTYNDLDGVGVTLWGGSEGQWNSQNESLYSEVEIRLVKDQTTGIVNSVTYNRTWRDAYIYGSYEDWAMVNVTEWYQNYNETTGNWEWIEAPHLIWNWTTLTGWHWEHLTLNQTEYAINPSSPNIWINMKERWLPNDDPAYQVKRYNITTDELIDIDYAELATADMSLVKGIVTVDLNITFSADSPQTRYSWDLLFLNTTFGSDSSKGWGEHEVTSWTTEPIYYVNSTATDYVPWYVTRPEAPLSTIFNGTRYLLDETPYITIKGTDYPIQVQTYYDWGSSEERTEILLWDQYDPTIGDQPRYYLLPNGTKILIREGYMALIRSFTINATDVYRLTGTLTNGWEIDASTRDYLSTGTVVETFMDRAEQDWGAQYRYQPDPIGEPWRWEWAHPYYYELLDGTRIYRDQPFENQNYNWTTNRWDLSNKVYLNESVTSSRVKPLGRGVLLNNTLLVLLYDHSSWWQPLPDGTGYYITMNGITYENGVKQYDETLAGTAIIHEDPWEVSDDERYVLINGVTYLVRDWPEDYYEGTYNDQTIIIKSGGQGYVYNFYYTMWPDGLIHEMPYPGAGATSWWDLEGTESEGQKLPTQKYLTLNGEQYVLHLSDDVGVDYYIVYHGTPVSVTWPIRDLAHYYCVINGDEFWNVTQTGWNLNLGIYSWRVGFTPTVPFVTTTGFNEENSEWTEWDRVGRDAENATLYLTAVNGTRYDLQTTLALYIWKVEIGGEFYYTFNDWTQTEQVYDPKTLEYRWKNYIVTIDGEKVYFDWEQTPPNFVEECRLLVPGTNYTRLIPYDWGTKHVFDTINIFKITINNNVTGYWDGSSDWTNPYYNMTTGVFYQNGTEVLAGTTFNVIGGPAGPSTRTWYDENYTYGGGDSGNWWVYHLSDEEELSWMADWSSQASWSHIVTLDGTHMFFVPGFNEQWWPTHSKQWSPQPWDWTENKTTTVVEDGYAIYLNDTIKIDVTTAWPRWSENNEYLMMTNGTRINIQWNSELGHYMTMINDEFYAFREVHTLCNVTDSGVVYSVADPYNRIKVEDQWDRSERLLEPTPRWTTLVYTDWLFESLWMNATSDSVLLDGAGYYLINASNQTRLNLTAVCEWWNDESMGERDDVFRDLPDNWVIENHIPLYNVTLNGQEYFVFDPSPIGGASHSTDRWENRWSVEPWNAYYRYPETFDVTLDGKTYTIRLKPLGESYWDDQPFPEEYPDIHYSIQIIDLYNALDVEEENRWKPALSVTLNGEEMAVQLEDLNIYKKHILWGELYTWKLTEIDVMTVRSIWDLVVGTPEWDMWGIRTFETVPETGAVDLDGDLSTTEDQYFVRRLHYGSDSWNRTEYRMWVGIIWNPNSTLQGDEVHIGAWTGRLHTAWSSEWSEYYLWYYASNMSGVNTETMRRINNTLLDSDTGIPNPGYWDIAHMAKNSTWEDLLSEAQMQGWDWITDNTNEWEWIWFGFSQDYLTSWFSDNELQEAGVGLRYEFAGLSLFNFTEQTHYFIPETIGNVTFMTPGESFGNRNASDTMLVGPSERVTFGVTYTNVNGTIFPFAGGERSMWGWYDSIVYGADFTSPNFNEKPTDSIVDEISLAVHFNATTTPTNEANNEVSVKIDQHIGGWTLDHNVIDGRTQNLSDVDVYLRGNEVLRNRSLASNWYVEAYTDMRWQVRDAMGSTVNNNNVTESNKFDLQNAFADVSFATVRLGSTYDWYKPIALNDTVRTLNVTSKTTPLGNFKAMFQKEDGKSSAGFALSSKMYFLSTIFPQWEGYKVYNDPEIATLVSKGTVFTTFNPNGIPFKYFVLLGVAVAGVAITIHILHSKRKRLTKPPTPI